MKQRRQILHEQRSQMITLMGITLALSVFIISSIPSEISDYSTFVQKNRSNSLVSDFLNIRETFGLAVNYKLLNMSVTPTGPSTTINYYGRYGKFTVPHEISTACSTIELQLKNNEFRYGRIFTANVIGVYYSHYSSQGQVYYVDVDLQLRDGSSIIEQVARYNILCAETPRP